MHHFLVHCCVEIVTRYSETNELKIEIYIFRTLISFAVDRQGKFRRINSPATWSDCLRKRLLIYLKSVLKKSEGLQK